jgi:predicted RNase H-like HicB family nuclease
MTYDVLLTKQGDKFIARVCQWPAIVAAGDTEDDALCKVQADIQSLLAGGREEIDRDSYEE